MKKGEDSAPQLKAVMAVDVGAESKPQEGDQFIRSRTGDRPIVDSVLADLRPRIVERIACRRGKKK